MTEEENLTLSELEKKVELLDDVLRALAVSVSSTTPEFRKTWLRELDRRAKAEKVYNEDENDEHAEAILGFVDLFKSEEID